MLPLGLDIENVAFLPWSLFCIQYLLKTFDGKGLTSFVYASVFLICVKIACIFGIQRILVQFLAFPGLIQKDLFETLLESSCQSIYLVTK